MLLSGVGCEGVLVGGDGALGLLFREGGVIVRSFYR